MMTSRSPPVQISPLDRQELHTVNITSPPAPLSIFFYDSKRNVIGAAHSWWRGCLKNICLSVIITVFILLIIYFGIIDCNIKK